MRGLEHVRVAARNHPHADLAVAAVVLAVTLVTTAVPPANGRLTPIALIAAGLACGALVVRRNHPVAALLISAAGAEAYLLYFNGRHGSLVLAAPLIALYTVAESTVRRRALTTGVLAAVAFAGLHMLVIPESWLGVENLALAALGGLAVAAGDASRNRRAYLVEAEARARYAEADRDSEAARRVAEERLRIARDLHDAVGHHLALIHVQTKVAEHLLDTSPDQSRQALAHVRDASRSALHELSDTVAVLRQPGEPAAPTEPVVGLSGVEDLLAAFRRSGLAITNHVDGPPLAVPAPVDLTAYRVLQEALTNVYKHVGPTEVDVRLTFQPDALRIVVDNTAPAAGSMAPPAAAPGGRHGLVGMRERVAALGGKLQTGPRPDGGYRVSAMLPLSAGSVG